MFYTFQLSYHALDTNCIALYTYSEKDLESILKNPTREDLWFLVEKIEIMDECKYRDYTNFLKIAAKSNLEVDFRGYEFLSKGIANIGEIAKNQLNNMGIKNK